MNKTLPNNIYVESDLGTFLETSINILLQLEDNENIKTDSTIYIGKEYNILTFNSYVVQTS